ncbi:MAG TPA: amidohydrolase [Planctomycetaceae bacterium]|nr:amidohydrolase [Planctomycetaceae bacterium]
MADAGPNTSLADVVEQCQKVMAHAWMVRTFVKHSEEVEDFPELMGIVRAVFDTSRALETRVEDPPGYLKMLRKKIGKVRVAANQFEADAPSASTHTNFQQAVISMNFCLDQLEELLAEGDKLAAKASS